MTRTGKKRYICSYVKRDNKDGELKPNVVVVAAANPILARVILCQQYGAVDKSIRNNNEEGIKTIRQAETNIYEGEMESESFIDAGSDT